MNDPKFLFALACLAGGIGVVALGQTELGVLMITAALGYGGWTAVQNNRAAGAK